MKKSYIALLLCAFATTTHNSEFTIAKKVDNTFGVLIGIKLGKIERYCLVDDFNKDEIICLPPQEILKKNNCFISTDLLNELTQHEKELNECIAKFEEDLNKSYMSAIVPITEIDNQKHVLLQKTKKFYDFIQIRGEKQATIDQLQEKLNEQTYFILGCPNGEKAKIHKNNCDQYREAAQEFLLHNNDNSNRIEIPEKSSPFIFKTFLIFRLRHLKTRNYCGCH